MLRKKNGVVGGVVLRWGRLKPLAVQNTLSHPPPRGSTELNICNMLGTSSPNSFHQMLKERGKGQCSSLNVLVN